MKAAVLTVIVLVVVAIAGGLIVMYTGVYNVAADKENSALKTWVLSTTSDHSVESRAGDVKVPKLGDKQQVLLGAAHYSEMCVGCHGAPGHEQGEIAKGLNPEPPKLVDSAKELSPAELYWFTKHGVEMTGMPAWGKTHPDEKIWAMVAFMTKFPKMSKAQYDALVKESAAVDDDDDD